MSAVKQALTHKCGYCQKNTASKLRCPVCHQIYYCNEKCFKDGWNEHKKLCGVIKKWPSNDVKNCARKYIEHFRQPHNWQYVVMCLPLLPEILNNTNLEYRLWAFDVFVRAFQMQLQLALETDPHTTLEETARIRNRLIGIEEQCGDLCGEFNHLDQQGMYILDIGVQYHGMLMYREAKKYMDQAQRIANQNGLYTLESMVDTALGQYYLSRNDIEAGIHYFRMAVSAAQNNIVPGTWIYVMKAISPLLSALMKYKSSEECGESVQSLLNEHIEARIHAARISGRRYIISELNEFVFQMKYYEVVHNPIMFTRMNHNT